MPKYDASWLRNTDPEAELARRHLRDFISYTRPGYEWNWHHTHLCDAMDQVLAGTIPFLMVFMPPQCGKSEIVSRLFPPYALGREPDLRLAGCSYAHDLAAKFNRSVQRTIMRPEYQMVFPATTINGKNIRTDVAGSWLRNADEFEVVGREGGYISVGIGGPLTGNKVDILIIDDPVKNAVEGKSPTVQKRNIEWWETVAKTRLHNDSRVVLCMTRWDELDLAGYLLEQQRQGVGMPWRVISFPAIKEDDADASDPRQIGEALWPSHHSLERLTQIKESRPAVFTSLYQQQPKPPPGGRVYPNWKHVDAFPDDLVPFYGMDFGFTNDPTTVVKVAAQHRHKLYVQELIYSPGLTNRMIYDRLLPLLDRRDAQIYADSAEPKSIKELSEFGLNMTPCVKGPDSVLAGIQSIHEFDEVYIVDPSPNLSTEAMYYQWLLSPDGKPTNTPVDAFNHAMDGIRYAVTGHLGGPNPRVRGFSGPAD